MEVRRDPSWPANPADEVGAAVRAVPGRTLMLHGAYVALDEQLLSRGDGMPGNPGRCIPLHVKHSE